MKVRGMFHFSQNEIIVLKVVGEGRAKWVPHWIRGNNFFLSCQTLHVLFVVMYRTGNLSLSRGKETGAHETRTFWDISYRNNAKERRMFKYWVFRF